MNRVYFAKEGAQEMKQRKISPADDWEQMEEYGLVLDDFPDVEVREYQRGESLCQQGCPMEHLLFVVEGRVKVCSVSPADKTLLFCYNGPGTIVGEVELMTGGCASTTLKAACPVRCLAIPLGKYREKLRSNIVFMNCIALMMARIVTRNSINDSFNILAPLDLRLRAYIARNNDNGLFTAKLTETAEYLGVSYRHLLRTMNELCSKGALEKEQGRYRIKKAEEFEGALENGEWSPQQEK